jgi:predicted dehydrogenase
VKIGTVGTGFVVPYFISAAREVPGVEISAAYLLPSESKGSFAEEHGIAQKFTSRDEFLKADFDFVYIASPNSLHFVWAKDALLAGKNVICEKPFTSNLREAEELSMIAKENELFLFEAMTVPHLPNLKLIKEKLPEIGRIKFAQINFSQYSSRYDVFLKGNTPNVFNPEFSGGALMDLGCYNIGFCTELFGVPDNLSYYANLADNGIDTSGILLFEYDDFFATAVAAKDSRSKNFIQIQGENGYIYVTGESSRCLDFTVFLNNGEKEFFDIQGDKDVLFFGIAEFKHIFDDRNFEGRDYFLEKTLTISNLLDQARKSAGIVFPADV